MMEQGLSKTEMARRLGRHRATIHREFERNSNVSGYRPDGAARLARARKLRGSRIERSARLGLYVEDRIAMGWSPEQIAGRMELEELEHRVSAGSICRHACSPAGRRAGLPRQLAQRKAKRAGEGAPAPAHPRSRTASRSAKGLKRQGFAPSSGTGKAIRCISGASATFS